MGDAGYWGKGFGNEYREMERLLSNADLAQHQRFVKDLRDGLGVVEARNNAYGTNGIPLAAFELTNRNWFGLGKDPNPMWMWDCTVTPEQIHVILRESYLRMVELYMEHPDNTLEIWIQCGHGRFRTLLTWPSAERESAVAWSEDRPRTDGELIRLWVHTPFNSGYAMGELDEATHQRARALRDQWIGDVEAGRKRPEDMQREDVRDIAGGFKAGHTLWRKSPLAVKMGGPPKGDPSVIFIPNADEPLFEHLGYYVPDMERRFVPGIEISWPGAGDGKLFPSPVGYVNHSDDWT